MEKRFRASIYVDVWVDEEDLEKAREIATEKVEEFQEEIPNSFVGGVALYRTNLLKPLDKEI